MTGSGWKVRAASTALGLVFAHALSHAQASAAASAPQAPARAASSAQSLDRVEVSGERAGDTEQRRRSTAAKIIVGRDEIERYGDTTLGEVLKRLPGVTMQGAPGRGGGIRMRGLGGGYTQILLDGERVPPGFSLDSLTPEQIERIEILRAPTAETGARAIAGTINIITREGFRKRLNDWRIGAAVENGHVSPGLAWTRNQALGDWTANLSLSAFHQRRNSESVTHTVDTTPADGSTSFDQREHSLTQEHRSGLHLTSRLQWRGDGGEVLTLSPFVILSQGGSTRRTELVQDVPDPAAVPPLYDRSATDADSRFSLLRLNGQWNHRLGDGARLEWRAGAGRATSRNHSLRSEFDAGAADAKRRLDDDATVRDDSLSTALKWMRQLDSEHSLVGGVELEGTRRNEAHTSTETTTAFGTRPVLDDAGDNFHASTARVALYGQDEWDLSPHWSAHAGLRWEGITTTADGDAGSTIRNRSSVWTPIAHAVWKPDPKGRDQVRVSLTRSYRTPTLANLITRPSVASRYPLDGPINTPTSPDRVGNGSLKPELATGIDVAIERYLPGGGIVSANVFHRQIHDLIRTLTTLETPPWAHGAPRWVARPQNIGDAITQGIELEAKFRASDLWPQAPALDLRSNVSLFRSRVKSVPGPDNRLDQQPSATANLGADYRLRGGLPLTVGGNLNWNPSYATRLSEDQYASQGLKRVVDAYALWVVRPGLQWRLTASNLAPLDYVTASTVANETATTTARSYINWQLRLEMKL
jgi:outer membrane receptor for ferrienterochelin and colicins